MLSVTFYGVRGSTPCCCEATRGFGGNTACVLVQVEGDPPLICDLGTGLRYLGGDIIAARDEAQRAGDEVEPFVANALVSHLHWDHIQGLPFFRPVLAPDSTFDIYGPCQPGSSFEVELGKAIQPPTFPVGIGDLPGTIRAHEVDGETFSLGSATVTSFTVPHVGPTNGYRVDAGSGSVAFLCDHQQPVDGSHEIPDHIVEACQGVDVLIHDSQYDADEFAMKADWGHCTPDFALALARECGAKRLVLFHHDPGHDDAWIRNQACRVAELGAPDVEVLAAAEGLTLHSS